jgi:hypothetical protein
MLKSPKHRIIGALAALTLGFASLGSTIQPASAAVWHGGGGGFHGGFHGGFGGFHGGLAGRPFAGSHVWRGGGWWGHHWGGYGWRGYAGGPWGYGYSCGWPLFPFSYGCPGYGYY